MAIRDPERAAVHGMQEHHLRFRLEVGGKTYMGDRYSPEVDTGPGASWMPVERVVDCYYDPDDPSMVFLARGSGTKSEPINWLYLVVLPALLLGAGAHMRFFPERALASDD